MRCLVTGATGYIGGRLVPRLLAEGHQVRCMTRSASRLRDVPWASQTEIAEADALDAGSLARALDDIAEHVPDPSDGLVGADRALELALAQIRDADVETRWSTAVWPDAPSDPLPTDPDWAGGAGAARRRQQARGRAAKEAPDGRRQHA